jgi:3-deoxy-7-phosphoheptulonate synthase
VRSSAALVSAPEATLPLWPSARQLDDTLAELRRRAPLVRFARCRALQHELERVAAGDGFLVQAGDCAELFAEVSERTSMRKATQLRELSRLVADTTGRRAVVVGRIAGQFAKPRSAPLEYRAGTALPVYRGDAVNCRTATAVARRPDAERLLTAYDKAAETLGHLAGLPVFTSHEALLLEYEEALVRADSETGARYASSADLLWVGDRTRQAGGAHIGLLAGIANPVAVKLGPTATPRDVVALVNRLDPARRPGRLVFVARLGAARVRSVLPRLAEAARAAGAQPVWLCDPMHGNTVRIADGRKTRTVDDVIEDVLGFVHALRGAGVHPAGIHLETTPDPVTECVETRSEARTPRHLPRYWTGCDPRLNPGQARRVTAAFAAAVTA